MENPCLDKLWKSIHSVVGWLEHAFLLYICCDCVWGWKMFLDTSLCYCRSWRSSERKRRDIFQESEVLERRWARGSTTCLCRYYLTEECPVVPLYNLSRSRKLKPYMYKYVFLIIMAEGLIFLESLGHTMASKSPCTCNLWDMIMCLFDTTLFCFCCVTLSLFLVFNKCIVHVTYVIEYADLVYYADQFFLLNFHFSIDRT